MDRFASQRNQSPFYRAGERIVTGKVFAGVCLTIFDLLCACTTRLFVTYPERCYGYTAYAFRSNEQNVHGASRIVLLICRFIKCLITASRYSFLSNNLTILFGVYLSFFRLRLASLLDSLRDAIPFPYLLLLFLT